MFTPEGDAARLAQLTGRAGHEIAVVLGSGWAEAAEAIGTDPVEVPFTELGGIPPPTVAGHRGVVRSVMAAGRPVLVFLGRVHLYEGHPPSVVAHPVRTALAAGCRMVVLTNAAGGIRAGLDVGQPVLISDHINLTGMSPLEGPCFIDLVDAYSPRLRDVARSVQPDLPEGVYAALRGPQFETPAEIRMLMAMGADLVGMSTALECIAARAGGAEVVGVSLVTNPAAGLTPGPLDHQDVLAAAKRSAGHMGELLAGIVERA